MQKTKFFAVIVLLVCMSGCEKDETQCSCLPNFAIGKWKSISQYSNSNWVGIPQPHIVEFKDQNTNNFTYTDHNGVVCNGSYQYSVENGKYYVDFPKSDCGFTKRELIIVSKNPKDTIELRVLTAPNITAERVRYVPL